MGPTDRLQDAWFFQAHLDRVALHLHLDRPTQPRYLRDAFPLAWHGQGGAPFARPVSGSASTTDTSFIVWVQDPPSPANVRCHLARLNERFTFAREPTVAGIEVAFDAFPIVASANLVDMAERLFRCITDPPSDNRRILGKQGSTGDVESAMLSRRANRQALQRGLTIFTGEESDPHTQRTYIKDNRHARFENTLTRGAQPFTTLEQWQRFRFESLSHLFRWRRFVPTDRPGLRSFHAMLGEHLVILDRAANIGARERHKRVHSRSAVADRELSDAARQALRRLTTAQRRG